MELRRTLWPALITLLLTAACSSSTVPPSVRGRIFLITQGGDLKPARLATVYLVKTTNVGEKTAAQVKELAEYCSTFEEQIIPMASSSIVRKWRSSIPGQFAALEDVYRASSSGAITVTADEEGYYTFATVPAGEYILAVFGRAGANQGYWEEPLVLKGDQQLELKQSSPKVACLML